VSSPDDERGWGPLLYACYSLWHRAGPDRAAGLDATIRTVLDAGASPDSHNGRLPNRGYRSALHGCASTDKPAACRFLLERGANPAARDKEGWSAYSLTMFSPATGVFHHAQEEILKLLPKPAPARLTVDATWNPETLLSSCFMTRAQLAQHVDDVQLDGLVLTALERALRTSGDGLVQIVRAERHGMSTTPQSRGAGGNTDASLSLQVEPHSTCAADQTGDILGLSIAVRLVRVRDHAVILKKTVGGGLQGLHMQTVNNPEQYFPVYDGWVRPHAGSIYEAVEAALARSLP
jgi:hypothetical protein